MGVVGPITELYRYPEELASFITVINSFCITPFVHEQWRGGNILSFSTTCFILSLYAISMLTVTSMAVNICDFMRAYNDDDQQCYNS